MLPQSGRRNRFAFCLAWWVFAGWASLLLFLVDARAQTYAWQTDPVDLSGAQTSLAVDDQGSLHMSYVNDREGVKYAFRPVDSTRWFTLVLAARGGSTKLTLDQQGHPHICYTSGKMNYAAWDGKEWNPQEIAPGAGQISYTCSVAVAADGTPHLLWYQYQDAMGRDYLHIKYAVLQDGAWVARTLDFDAETGKWNSMALDANGNPHIAYCAFARGALKHAFWNGKNWIVEVVDQREGGSAYRGMGNSIVVDSRGNAHISYFDEVTLKYARQQDNGWKIESVDSIATSPSWQGYRSSLVLDQRGFPHIAYEDGGLLKHAYWDGQRWRIQVLARSGTDLWRNSSLAINKEGTLYLSYRDPLDGSLKLATGRLTAPAASASNQKIPPK